MLVKGATELYDLRFAENIPECTFFHESFRISIQISLKLTTTSLIDIKSSLC